MYIYLYIYSPISFAVGVLAVFKGSAPRFQEFAKKLPAFFVEKMRLLGFERRTSREKRWSKKIPAFLSRKISCLLWKRVFLLKKVFLDGWFPYFLRKS